ncbi:WD40 repeat domain-containing serine/threonine protein kinase [Actinomadura litoris]|uniref:non-specific serine/threonine protein kinase n=1 Tax=Actinomadura litoris TaxID=2678616 RepID=A0A7K1KY23_9ACTN|nr:serine/threonine-protein kinase [Actinomadura litoris]MUN37059.1 protein kinase [Actinomadura litoris]
MTEDAPVGGRYRLLDAIGRGGMGVVWRAHDDVLDREVAVKEVLTPPGLAADGEWYARTLREARSAARLRHASVITVYDVAWHDERPWIVMEFVPGRTLADEIAGGPLPPERVAQIGALMLDGLRAAHAAGVTHRDVKPGNVLLDGDRVILTDFGIAAAEGMTALTASGAILGTPSYMAPEQARSGAASPASDLWSLGATLYAAVEGEPPFRGPTAMAILSALLTEEPRPPVNAGPLRPVLDGLLRKDPALRIAAEEAAALLAPTARERRASPPRRLRPPTPIAHLSPDTLSLDALPCVVSDLAFSPDGRTLATALPDEPGLPAAWLWDVASRQMVHSVSRSKNGRDAARVRFLPGGGLLVSDGAVFTLTRPKVPSRRLLAAHERFAQYAMGSRSGEPIFATKSADSPGVLLYRFGEAGIDLGRDNGGLGSGAMVFDPDGVHLAVVTRERDLDDSRAVGYKIELWDVARARLVNVLTGHRGEPRAILFAPDGSRFLSRAPGEQPRLWDVLRRFRSPLLTTLDTHARLSGPQAFDRRDRLAIADGDTLHLWKVNRDPRRVASLHGHTGGINDIAFGLRDQVTVTAADDAAVRVWDTATALHGASGPHGRSEAASVAVLTGHDGPVLRVVANRDGTVLASAGGDRSVRLWELSRRGRR